jgi:diguanylate cyclase (GGDEF)-like protein
MTDTSDRARSSVELAQLHEDIEAARRVLNRLLQETVTARMMGPREDDSLVVQVNERLVTAALRSQAEWTGRAPDGTACPAIDPVTGLSLRDRMLDQLSHGLALARRHDRVLALLDVELDSFAQIQASVGRQACDILLRTSAERIQASIRDCDLASHHDDGRFLIALVEIAGADHANLVARRVVTALCRPMRVGGQWVALSASVGISVYPDHGERIEALLDIAARARARARRERLGTWRMADGSGSPVGAERTSDRPASSPEADPGASEAPAAQATSLREANERLVMAALDARELNDALLQAQQRHVNLLGVVAEELRDPQAPVRVAASLLGRMQVDQDLLPRVQSMLDEQMRRMKQLLERLDGVVSTRMGPLTLVLERIDLRDAVHEAIAQVQVALRVRAQQVDLQLGVQPLDVMGDMDRLVQVMANLLDNASKYSGEGATITVAGSLLADSVVVEVRDNGIGLAADAISRIFAPFWHDAEALVVGGTGVGIGLTVVRRLVEAHCATVQAFSAGRGLGSRFVVTLPCAPD